MGKRIGLVSGLIVVAAVGMSAAYPMVGEAADMGGSKIVTLSLTKDYTASPWTHDTGYSQQAMGKLGFGVKNTLLGWTELFTEPKEALDKGDNFFVGLGKGLKNGIEDTLGGIVHIVTFPLPQIDAPLPQGGVSLMSS